MRVTSSWDDGTKEDLRLAELLKQYRIEAIFYFPFYGVLANERVGRTSLSAEERQQIAKDFTIGSHTLTHPLLTRVNPTQAKAEIEYSRVALQDEFGQPIDSFCYPRGYANPELQMMVKDAGYKDARSTLVGYIMESENPYFTQTAVHVGCNRKEYGGQSWLDYAKNLLDEAIKTPDSVYHMFGHSWELTKNDGWHDLEELLKEVSKHES